MARQTGRNFVVTVKETSNGAPWLLFEPYEDVGLSDNLHVTLNLPPEASIEDAREAAKFLNSHIASLKIAHF